MLVGIDQDPSLVPRDPQPSRDSLETLGERLVGVIARVAGDSPMRAVIRRIGVRTPVAERCTDDARCADQQPFGMAAVLRSSHREAQVREQATRTT